MYLQDGTRDHFMKFLEREFPAMRPRFEKLYAGKYPPHEYRREVKAIVRVLQERYGVRTGSERDAGRPDGERAAPHGAEQKGFAW